MTDTANDASHRGNETSQAPADRWRSDIQRPLRKALNRLLGVIRGAAKEKVTQTDARPQFIDQQREGLIEMATRQHDALRPIVFDLAQRYWETGREDAINGQRRARFDAVADSAARLLRQESLSQYNAKRTQFERERETKQLVLSTEESRFRQCSAHLTILEAYLRTNPRLMSIPLATVYVLIGLALIVADTPLALKLTQVGFDLDLAEVWEIRRFFEAPALVFRDNWEVFILAGGISLCAVYVKIFYDRYSAAAIPALPTESGSNSADNLHSRVTPRAHAYFSRGVFLLTLLTIIMLGIFRYTANQQSREMEDSATAATHFAILFQNQDFRAIVACITFILITLLFPVIGGICLSLGLNQFHNRLALCRANRESRRGTRAYERASQQLAELLATASDWDGMLQWLQNDEFLKTITALLKGSYRHGYEHGWMQSMTAVRDPLAAAEILRRNAWAHGISEWINTETESDLFRGHNLGLGQPLQ